MSASMHTVGLCRATDADAVEQRVTIAVISSTPNVPSTVLDEVARPA